MSLCPLIKKGLLEAAVFAVCYAQDFQTAADLNEIVACVDGFQVLLVPHHDELGEDGGVVAVHETESEVAMHCGGCGCEEGNFALVEFGRHGVVDDAHAEGSVLSGDVQGKPAFDIIFTQAVEAV